MNTGTATMTKNEIVSKAKELCANPDTNEAWKVSWNRVIDHLEPLYRARKGIKSFEVHHSTETARLAFLTAAVEGKDLDTCERAAIEAVAV